MKCVINSSLRKDPTEELSVKAPLQLEICCWASQNGQPRLSLGSLNLGEENRGEHVSQRSGCPIGNHKRTEKACGRSPAVASPPQGPEGTSGLSTQPRPTCFLTFSISALSPQDHPVELHDLILGALQVIPMPAGLVFQLSKLTEEKPFIPLQSVGALLMEVSGPTARCGNRGELPPWSCGASAGPCSST